MRRAAKFRRQIPHELLLLFGQRRRPARERAGLNHEPRHDAVKGHAVVHARRREAQELPDVNRRLVRKEGDRHGARARVEHSTIRRELLRRLRRERLRRGRRRVADRHVPDLDALGGQALVVHRGLRNLPHHLHAIRHVAEHRVLAVEPRLIDDDDEELRACAVGFPRDEHRRRRSLRHLRHARVRLHRVQSPRAVLRPPGGIPRQGIAALHHPVLHHAVKRGPVVGALTSERHEVGDVVRGRLRREVDHEEAGRRLDDRLPGSRRLMASTARGRVGEIRRVCRRCTGKNGDDPGQQERGDHLAVPSIRPRACHR